MLVCPSCATGHDDGERFCGRCGMPLVHEGADAAAGDAGARADRSGTDGSPGQAAGTRSAGSICSVIRRSKRVGSPST